MRKKRHGDSPCLLGFSLTPIEAFQMIRKYHSLDGLAGGTGTSNGYPFAWLVTGQTTTKLVFSL
ncbi:MAG: hypothetical protein AUI12_07340 [Acidobacteria bacterium 13_2_20CM_2_57_6]|nr:MAG: hypothetical protein AUH16_04610 [Acidobacteria bacterium 13_2_20CM_57_7]OLB87271.1 MAG: hypothetical protein AUI12_07340 [Acidobacteria bacterium 13_2_20CM_2_57_6]